MKEKLKIRVVNRYDDLKQLTDQWNELLSKSLHPMVFLTYQWIDVWWKSFGKGKEPFIILVYDGDELIGIAPFMIESSEHTIIARMDMKVKVRKIEFIANVHSNRADLILARDPAHACDAIIDFLLDEQQKSWDLLSLEYLLISSPTMNHLRNSLDKRNICYRQYFQMSSPFVPINCRWDDYFGNRQKRFREQLKSRLKKLEGCGRVRLEEYRSIGELEKVLEKIFEVASKSWKAKDGTALSSTRQLKEFYTDLAYTAANEGWLDLFVLYLEEEPLVFEYCLKYENKLLLLKTEFNESYRPYGIGNMIQWKLLETIFENGAEEFEFLGPSARWKTHWSEANERRHVTLYAFNKNYKGRYLNFMYAIKDGAKRVVERMKVLDSIKGQKTKDHQYDITHSTI